ncbi:MAG: NapC/NirT family cytochrome c [bacterium]|nr:NapC/NirT family cytochrome c [bacterium]
MSFRITAAAWLGLALALPSAAVAVAVSDAAHGTRSYDDYEKPATCSTCHDDIFQQWKQAMMSQAYTHHWDEIEYFELAVPHAEKDAKVAGVKAGCNGCHAPTAFLAGDTPPPRPEENSRADESVHCDHCHTVTGFVGDIPHNFNWVSEPGRLKQGPKPGLVSPHHDTVENAFLRTGDFCGTCHNEMSPYGIWVKSTHLEWKEGPYFAQGVQCQDCHMPKADGVSARMGQPGLVAQHLFHGAHDPGKLNGSIEVRMNPLEREVESDGTAVIKVQLFNGKCGHKVPTGSVEDRLLWLDVTATDSAGRTWRLPVDPKGFAGEEYTIAADVLAYQDMGIAKNLPDFAGVQRDGVPVGSRIFRMPYFDPQGRMTMQQWNTASLGVDYRIGPRETKVETYSWEVPADAAPGRIEFRATLNYQLLVGPVADFLNVPAEESAVRVVNTAATWVEIYD